jgi:hypothetical protein
VKMAKLCGRGNLFLTIFMWWTTLAQDDLIRLSSGHPDTMSVVLDGTTLKAQETVQVINPPVVIFHDIPLTVEFLCPTTHQVGVEVRVWTLTQQDVLVFRDTWPCQSPSTVFYKRTIVKLPDSLRYRPSYSHMTSFVVEKCQINAWIISK